MAAIGPDTPGEAGAGVPEITCFLSSILNTQTKQQKQWSSLTLGLLIRPQTTCSPD